MAKLRTAGMVSNRVRVMQFDTPSGHDVEFHAYPGTLAAPFSTRFDCPKIKLLVKCSNVGDLTGPADEQCVAPE